MSFGFGRQQNNSLASRKAKVLRQREQRAGTMRSPALDSVERIAPRRKPSQAGNARRAGSAASGKQMRHAATSTYVRPVAARKSLPPLKSKLSRSAHTNGIVKQKQHTGLTAGWKLNTLWEPANAEDTSLQVISAEEQKKLATLDLEMRLPRIAGKMDPWLLISVLALLCIGLVMVFSASSFVAARAYGDPSYFFLRQLFAVAMGIAVMLVTMRIDYRQWRRYSLAGMLIVLPLLVLVLVVGHNVYGASRWIVLGSFFSFQPSELAKLVLALYIADWLARKGNQVSTFLYGLAPFVILVGIVLGLVLLENDMGTAIVIAGFATAMFFTAGANIIQFLLAMGCGVFIFILEAFKGYRYQRLIGFLDPFKHVTDLNLQLYQSLLALGSGGWFGLGLGESRQKTGYLPLPHIDSIFAIIGEELGFIGTTLVIGLFLFLAFRGFRLARRTQDIYGSLLATGITTWLILQAMVNIGATTGSIPYTGVPLPFISYGGTSLVISMAAVGVLLNISRYIQEPEKPALSRKTITKTIKKK